MGDKDRELLTTATKSADELPARINDREFLMTASKENLDQFNHPTLVRRGANDVSDVAESIRQTPAGRQNPELSNEVGRIEAMLKHPDATAGDFAAQYWRLGAEMKKPNITPEVHTHLLALQNAVRDAADTASGGTHFSDMLEHYKVEQGLVNESEGAKAIRDRFIDPITGTPTNSKLTSNNVRGSVLRHGANEFGDVLDPAARGQFSNLEKELVQHEMYQPANSSGAAQLSIDNPLSVISTGRDNPFNYFPLVKGGANWLFGGSRKATTEAADQAMMDPAKWTEMLNKYQQSISPIANDEIKSRVLRQLLLAPGRAGAANIGE